MDSSEQTPQEIHPVEPDRPLPAIRLDRDGVDRVLKRAVELQTADQVGPEALDETQIAEVAREIGLSRQHLRRAMAEEKAGLVRPTGPRTMSVRLLGPKQVAVGRPMRGAPKALLNAGAQWLERQEGMRITRKQADGISSEPDRGAAARLRSGLGITRGTGHLRKADAVVVRLEPLDGEESLVTATADLSSARRRVATGVVTTTILAGLIATLAAGSLGPLAWMLAAFFSVVIAGAWRAELLRENLAVKRGLERALDALDEAQSEPAKLESGMSGAVESARRFGNHIRLLGEAIRDGLRSSKS